MPPRLLGKDRTPLPLDGHLAKISSKSFLTENGKILTKKKSFFAQNTTFFGLGVVKKRSPLTEKSNK